MPLELNVAPTTPVVPLTACKAEPFATRRLPVIGFNAIDRMLPLVPLIPNAVPESQPPAPKDVRACREMGAAKPRHGANAAVVPRHPTAIKRITLRRTFFRRTELFMTDDPRWMESV